MAYWLLLEKSDETRVSMGIDAYKDVTGDIYHYDSLVPNHRNLSIGDFVILRKENEIHGIGTIGSITEAPSKKTHRRCPACTSTDIRKRQKKQPLWRCGKCGHEFCTPNVTVADVIAYEAKIVNFCTLNDAPSVTEIKSCATMANGESAQLSILQLHEGKVRDVLEGCGLAHGLYERHPTDLERSVIMDRAIELAVGYYAAKGWTVMGKPRRGPWSINVVKDGESVNVAVKGTAGKGHHIDVTPHELECVRSHGRKYALVVVSGIGFIETNGCLAPVGGHISTVEHPWRIDPDRLEPTRYKYATNVCDRQR